MNCYGMLLSSIQTRRLSPSSKLEDIGGKLRSLCAKSNLQRFADHVQDDEDVAGLLEDLREAISDYQVCSLPWLSSRY